MIVSQRHSSRKKEWLNIYNYFFTQFPYENEIYSIYMFKWGVNDEEVADLFLVINVANGQVIYNTGLQELWLLFILCKVTIASMYIRIATIVHVCVYNNHH